MTNLDHYRLMLRDIESPDAFIDWSFRWMVSAALQRRVWTPLRGFKVYPNMFLFLVAGPSVGKGMSLKPARDLLSWHRVHDRGPHDADAIYRRLVGGQSAEEVLDKASSILTPDSTDKEKRELPLFPIGPDDTTYEQLVSDMANNPRMVRWELKMPDGTSKPQLYTHNSLAFVSTELANLINKNADGIVNFMLDAYDCPEKYEYRTKHQGKDCVHRCCLNFAAGTTPDYMAKTFDDSLLNEGMASRSFFIFAYEKRFYKLETDAESETQLRAKSHLLAWLRKLSSLYGEVRLTEEAKQHLKFWYENIHPKVKPNRDPKMVHYYGRKDLHVLKTAMAIHFSDSLEMEISLETLIKAMDVLEEAEKKMHLALQVGSKNPLANIARKITAWFVARENEPASFKEILEVFYTDGKSSDIIEILQYMQSIQKMSRLPEDKAAKLPERYQLNPQTLAADKLETASDLPFIESRQIVHPSLADGIRWGRKGKIILKKGLPFEEIAKLRRLMSEGIVTGVTGLGWE